MNHGKRKKRKKVSVFALERTRAFVTLNKFDKVQSPSDSNRSFHSRIRRITWSPYFQICILQGKENPSDSALFSSSLETAVSSVAHERSDTGNISPLLIFRRASILALSLCKFFDFTSLHLNFNIFRSFFIFCS